MGHRGENETSFDDGERSNHFCGYQNLHQQQVTTNPASKIAERETKAVMLGANPGRTLLINFDMKYIDADSIKDEIKHLKIDVYDESHQFDLGARCSLTFLESFIDSLQQEQLPGIEENGIPGKDFIPVEWVDACEKYGKWKIVKVEQPEVDLEKETIIDYVHNHYHYDKDFDGYGHSNLRPVFTREDLTELARHFYELGRLNARKEN